VNLGRLARRPRLRPAGDRVDDDGPRAGASPGGDGPTVTATLTDGPLAGGSVEIAVVEGRPPKTVDVRTRDGTVCRYCLKALMQSGSSATYTFVYRL
jgi:hypothetical protein